MTLASFSAATSAISTARWIFRSTSLPALICIPAILIEDLMFLGCTGFRVGRLGKQALPYILSDLSNNVRLRNLQNQFHKLFKRLSIPCRRVLIRHADGQQRRNECLLAVTQ